VNAGGNLAYSGNKKEEDDEQTVINMVIDEMAEQI